ncbi:MAG: reprolysin-like metallopeptidase, partial [Gaiellales bacterium]
MPRLANLVACSLALLALAAPVALADPPDVSDSLSGTLERTHEDTANGPRPINILSTADGPQVVTFPSGQPVPPNGSEVDLSGKFVNDTLAASAVTVTGPSLAVPTGSSNDAGSGSAVADSGTPIAAGAARTVAIVVITFGNGSTPSYTDTQLHGVLVDNSNSVSNYFAEQSWNQVSFTGIQNPDGDIFRVSIPAVPDPSCAWPTWGSEASSVVGASTLSQYQHVIYVFNSGGNCSFAGLAYMPGSQVYIDNYFTLPVVAHELGHNLGVHHAAALRCIVGGQPVAFANANGACSSSEYGDPYDIMGYSQTNQQDAFHKFQSGWLGALNGPRVQTIAQSGDYTVNPLEAASGVALLLIPGVTSGMNTNNSPATTLGSEFALDLRQTYGSYFDAFANGASATAGVEIHLVQTPGSYPPLQTQLIDTTPQTATFADAALVPGSTFTDGTNQITITTVSIDPLVGATVHVTIGSAPPPADTTPPTAVSNLSSAVASGPVVTLSFGAASDPDGIASYQVSRDGATLATLGSSATSFADWSATPGTHSYGVSAVDLAGNAGPTATVLATVPVPTPPVTTPTPTTPTPPKTPSRAPKRTVTIHVTTKVIAKHGHRRRVLVSWKRVAGHARYLVLRNGHELAVTSARSLLDRSAPSGTLRYTVRAAG